MPIAGRFLCALCAALLLATAARAMPDDTAQMRQIIATQFEGDVTAYVEQERDDFRRMACRKRNDLIQALLDDGLKLDSLSFETHGGAASCALQKKAAATLGLVLTPDLMTQWEDRVLGQKHVMSPLQYAIFRNDYDLVRVLLENGVHQAFNDEDLVSLTREEQFLLVANWAEGAGKRQALRAFDDMGFGPIMAAAKNKANVQFVRARVGKGGAKGGGGLLRSVAGGLAGAYLGGSMGAAFGILQGGTSGTAENVELDPTKPLPLPTGRANLGAQLAPSGAGNTGVQVVSLEGNSPAKDAGLVEGDVIVRIGTMPVRTRGSFYVATRRVVQDKQFEIEYLRAGTAMTAVIRQASPEAKATERDPRPSVAGTAANAAGEGRTLAELERLANLRDRGVLTEEEFKQMKARILAKE